MCSHRLITSYHLILNYNRRILNLKLLALNIYLIPHRLLLRQNLIPRNLSNRIHFPLILSPDMALFLVFYWAVQMHHIVRLIIVLIILSRKIGIIALLMLLQRRYARNIREKWWLLLLLLVLLGMLIPLLSSLRLLLITILLAIHSQLLILLPRTSHLLMLWHLLRIVFGHLTHWHLIWLFFMGI